MRRRLFFYALIMSAIFISLVVLSRSASSSLLKMNFIVSFSSGIMTYSSTFTLLLVIWSSRARSLTCFSFSASSMR